MTIKNSDKSDPPSISKKVVNQVEASLRKQMDQLIVQQCIARRFSMEDPIAYCGLREVREAVLNRLLVEGAGEEAGPLGSSLAIALISIFELFETRQGRGCIQTLDVDAAARTLRAESILTSPHWVLCDAEVVEDLLKLLSLKLDLVDQLREKYNYFDFFSVLAMVTRPSGEEAFLRYREAERGLTPRWPDLSDDGDLDFRFGRLFQLRDDPEDIDLACALHIARSSRGFDSSAVRIFDTKANPGRNRSEDDVRRLVLEIDLGSAPVDIDYAIGYLAKALGSLLVEEHKYWANVPNGDFYSKTRFAQGFDLPRLIRSVPQYSHSLLGLWMWDLVNDQKLRVIDAQKKIRQALSHQPLEELPKYLKRVTEFIAPVPGVICELDAVVTSPYQGRLGRRDAVHFNEISIQEGC